MASPPLAVVPGCDWLTEGGDLCPVNPCQCRPCMCRPDNHRFDCRWWDLDRDDDDPYEPDCSLCGERHYGGACG